MFKASPVYNMQQAVSGESCDKLFKGDKLKLCNNMISLANKYNLDLSKLSNSEKDVFDQVMKLQQIRDDEWYNNYQDSTEKSQLLKIQTNLNETVKNSSVDFNQSAKIVNDQVDSINDYNDLIRNQEMDLQQYKREDRQLRDDLNLRNRLVEINSASARLKRVYIQLLYTFGVVVMLMVFPFVAYLAGSLSIQSFFGIFIVLVMFYFIYVYYVLYSNSDSTVISRLRADARRFKREFRRFDRRLEKDIKQYLDTDCPGCIGDPRDWKFSARSYVQVK